MNQNQLKVSIVIPVYNEENRLNVCLKAVSNQSVKPCEIIIVDNNSTDKSVQIARSFKNVRIIHEKKQGMAYARNKGLDSAKGDIIGRIDADTLIPKDWVEDVQRYFTDNPEISGLTGYGRTTTGITNPILSDLWSYFYFTHCKAYFGINVMWGANMALRKDAWVDTKKLCYIGEHINNIHEDEDISLALTASGGRIAINPELKVGNDFYDSQYFSKFWRYNKMKHKTKKMHKTTRLPKSDKIVLIPHHKRLAYHVVSTPTVAFYMLFTLLNSGRRYLVG